MRTRRRTSFSSICGNDQAKGIVEVLVGSASRGLASALWKALRHDVPEASETAERRGFPAAPSGGQI